MRGKQSGTIPFKYRACCCNGAHRYNSTLAKADTSPGAEDGCPMYFVNSWARDGPATSDYWWSIVCALWPPVLLLIMTNYVDDVSIILHYYTLLHLIFLLVTTCYCNDHYYIVITYFYIVITCYYIYHYYLLLRIHYYILLHHYYLIITSLLPHYAISKIHVIMDSLLHIITLTCFIITSLLPIMSLFPIITYYWRGNLQMLSDAFVVFSQKVGEGYFWSDQDR